MSDTADVEKSQLTEESGNPPPPKPPRPPVVAAPAAGDPPTPPVASPPAAATVATGEVTEETLKLRAERDALADKLKRRDTDYSVLEQTHQAYRKTVEEGTAIPVKRKRGPLGIRVND